MYDTKLDIGCLVQDLTPLRIAIGTPKSVDSIIMGCGLPESSIEDNDYGGRTILTLSFNLFHSYTNSYLSFFSNSTISSAETNLAIGTFGLIILEDTYISSSFSSSQDTTLSLY